jgi:hypothetical protein
MRTLMMTTLRQVFGGKPQEAPPAQPRAIPQDEALQWSSIVLDGCDDATSQVLRLHISAAREYRSTWHLRGSLFSCIARHCGEGEARLRMQSFDAWLETYATD